MTGINDYGHLGPQQTAHTTTVSGSGTGTASPLSASSIQKSELEALVQLMSANFPILIPPISSPSGSSGSISSSSSIAAADVVFDQTKSDIINKMWDSYIEQLRQIADRMKEEDIKKETVDATKNGPKSSTEYFTYLMSVSASRRADETGESNGVSPQFAIAFNQWLVNPVTSGNNMAAWGVGAYPSAAFVVGAVAANPDAIRTAIGADSSVLGVQLSSSPVADALLAIGPTSGLPGDYQAAAALVAALLYQGALAKATVDTVAASGGKPLQDLNFALNYAQQTMAIVTKNIGAEDPTNPHRAGQNNMVRLMLSAMALNMVYRAAYGGMQGNDMVSVLAGNTADIPDHVRNIVDQLAGLVNFYMPKDAGARASTLAALMEYVDSKDSVDSMLETSRLYTSFLNTGDIDAKRLNTQTA